jgi:hypothetical protein
MFHPRTTSPLPALGESGQPLRKAARTMYPAVDGAPIDHDATLGEPFDNIGVAETVADVPSGSKRD